MNIKKRKLPITLSIASLIISAVCVGADTLYWVDATTYFNAAASGTIEGTGIIWNIDRDFSSAEKSKYSDAYNWATGYTIKEVKVTSDSGETTYYVPEYIYASSVTAPNENTDVYFKFTLLCRITILFFPPTKIPKKTESSPINSKKKVEVLNS